MSNAKNGLAAAAACCSALTYACFVHAQGPDVPRQRGAEVSAPRRHDGYYFQVTGGAGYFNASTEKNDSEKSFSGPTLSTSVLMGGTPWRGTAVGGGLLLDYSGAPSYVVNGEKSLGLRNFTQFLIGIGPFVDYYPDPADGLHFFGFVGLGGLETSVAGSVRANDPTGPLIAAGGGYDFWVADEWSIGALARFSYAPLSTNEESYSTIAPALLANFTYH